MNQKKKLKRFGLNMENTPPGPEGSFAASIPPAFAERVGLITVMWVHNEEMMSELFRELLQIKDHSVARITWGNIISPTARVRLMRAALEKAPVHKDVPSEVDDILREFEELSELRNKYVHSLWWVSDDDVPQVFIVEGAYTFIPLFGAREIEITELIAVVERMGLFRDRLIKTLRRHLRPG